MVYLVLCLSLVEHDDGGLAGYKGVSLGDQAEIFDGEGFSEFMIVLGELLTGNSVEGAVLVEEFAITREVIVEIEAAVDTAENHPQTEMGIGWAGTFV